MSGWPLMWMTSNPDVNKDTLTHTPMDQIQIQTRPLQRNILTNFFFLNQTLAWIFFYFVWIHQRKKKLDMKIYQNIAKDWKKKFKFSFFIFLNLNPRGSSWQPLIIEFSLHECILYIVYLVFLILYVCVCVHVYVRNRSFNLTESFSTTTTIIIVFLPRFDCTCIYHQKKNHISYLNCGTIFWLNETNNFMAYIISDSKA